jgi:hypothetical protein
LKELVMKPIFQALALIVSLLATGAWAHGDATPQHGGFVQVVNDVQFELVPATSAGGPTALYVFDHGKPLDASKLGGKLTVLVGTQMSEAPLKVAGKRLEAAGLTLAPKAKVVATVTGLPGAAATATVRFTVP